MVPAAVTPRAMMPVVMVMVMVMMMVMMMPVVMVMVMVVMPVAARGRFAGGEYRHAKHHDANEDKFLHSDHPSYMWC
jgi:hypothetical protein